MGAQVKLVVGHLQDSLPHGFVQSLLWK